MLEEFSTSNSEQTSSSSSSSNIDVNRIYIVQYNQYSLFHSLSKLLDLSLVWFKQHSTTNDNNQVTTASSAKSDEANKTKTSDTCDIFRDGVKTIMSIFVLLTNDSGNFILLNKGECSYFYSF
jgi:hypothetical protein